MKRGDTRPTPGDIVLLRGTDARSVWSTPPVLINDGGVKSTGTGQRAGTVMPGTLGLVISSAHPGNLRYFTYVLWSMPCICGWIEDGVLRKV